MNYNEFIAMCHYQFCVTVGDCKGCPFLIICSQFGGKYKLTDLFKTFDDYLFHTESLLTDNTLTIKDKNYIIKITDLCEKVDDEKCVILRTNKFFKDRG